MVGLTAVVVDFSRPFATLPFTLVYVVQRGHTRVLYDVRNAGALGSPVELASRTKGQPVAVVLLLRGRSPSIHSMLPYRKKSPFKMTVKLLPEHPRQLK